MGVVVVVVVGGGFNVQCRAVTDVLLVSVVYGSDVGSKRVLLFEQPVIKYGDNGEIKRRADTSGAAAVDIRSVCVVVVSY